MGGKLKSLILLLPVPLTYWLLYRYLESSGSWILLGFYALVPLLAAAGSFFPRGQKAFAFTAIILMIIYGIILVGEILLLPYQAYNLWFDLFYTSMERGRVSHLFVKLGSLLMVIICWVGAERKNFLDTVRSFIYLPVFFLFLLWPSVGYALLFLTTLLLSRLRKDNWKGLLVLLIIIMSVGLSGMKTLPKGARFIDNSSDNLITWLTQTWPSLPLLYDIPLYGESFAHSIETGRRPVLTNHTILTVDGPPGTQIYLRTNIAPQPGGEGDVLPLKDVVPVDGTAAEELPSYLIEIKTDYINLVPFTEDTAFIKIRKQLFPLETRDRTVLPNPLLFQGDSYRLYESKDEKVEVEADDFDFSPYLLPQQVRSEKLRALASSLRGETRKITADNIRAYLAENYTYTLDTEESLNYTEDFLFLNGEGYCLHFATAFVELARENDIPCRFSEGYLVIFPDDEEYWESYGYAPEVVTVGVTGFSSHVWPEVYLEEDGWTSIEATPPFYRADSRRSNDNLTNRQLRDILSENELTGEPVRRNPVSPQWYLSVPLLILIIWGIVKTVEILGRFGKDTLVVIRRYVRIAYSAGVERPRDEGWVEWNAKITEELPGAESLMKSVFPLILKARYAPYPLAEEEKEELHHGLREFKSQCKRARRK